MSKKIGIIIPSYNQGIFLEAAIVSVISNMKFCDIELILIDGGSTDNSIEIIRKYENKINYWVTERDNGQAHAINKGAKIIEQCDYIMWLNSDDVYDSELSVKTILDYAETTGYKVVYGKSFFIDEQGKKIGEYPTKSYNKELLKKECFLSQPSVMVEMNAWKQLGGLNESLYMCLDYEMWILLSKQYDFGYCNFFIGNTRIYRNTKTALMQNTHLNEAVSILSSHYNKVEMNWIYSKILADNMLGIVQKLPGKLIKLLSILLYKYVVKDAISKSHYVQR